MAYASAAISGPLTRLPAMAISVVMPRPISITSRARRSQPASLSVRSDESASRVVGVVTWVVLGYAVSVVLWTAYYFTVEPLAPRGYFIRDDLVAIAVVLPLLIGLIRNAEAGLRTRGSWSLLGALAIVVLGMIPFGGVLWMLELQLLAGAVLLIAPPPWSAVSFAVLVLLPVAVAHAERQAQWSTYLFMKTLQGGLSLAVLVWLVQVIRRAQAARVELAEAAIVAERLRIDTELTQSVNAALEKVISGSQRAAQELGDPQSAAIHLRALIELSRDTLAQARQTLAGYQVLSATTELQTAITLLSTGGVRAQLELLPSGLPEILPARLRADLRSRVASLLASETVNNCVIAVVAADTEEGFELQVRLGSAARRRIA